MILCNFYSNRVIILGKTFIEIFQFSSLDFDFVLVTSDWVCNVLWMDSSSLLTVSAHNVATVWSCNLRKKIISSSCDERCILYPLPKFFIFVNDKLAKY